MYDTSNPFSKENKHLHQRGLLPSLEEAKTKNQFGMKRKKPTNDFFVIENNLLVQSRPLI